MKRKMFSRSLASIMAVCLLVLSVGAVTDGTYAEITVSSDVDSQKAELIANTILGESPDGFMAISPSSIACIAGHSIARTTTLGTEHRVWAATPRCRETTYDVRYCTRSSCSYITYTVIGTSRIWCCN